MIIILAKNIVEENFMVGKIARNNSRVEIFKKIIFRSIFYDHESHSPQDCVDENQSFAFLPRILME